jgi:hypothetical protein
MISANGWDLWTLPTFGRMCTWLGRHGFEHDPAGRRLAALIDGDPGEDAFQRRILLAVRSIRRRLPRQAPEWICFQLDFASYVLGKEAFPEDEESWAGGWETAYRSARDQAGHHERSPATNPTQPPDPTGFLEIVRWLRSHGFKTDRAVRVLERFVDDSAPKGRLSRRTVLLALRSIRRRLPRARPRQIAQLIDAQSTRSFTRSSHHSPEVRRGLTGSGVGAGGSRDRGPTLIGARESCFAAGARVSVSNSAAVRSLSTTPTQSDQRQVMPDRHVLRAL